MVGALSAHSARAARLWARDGRPRGLPLFRLRDNLPILSLTQKMEKEFSRTDTIIHAQHSGIIDVNRVLD